MVIGIVGSEEIKFTLRGQISARSIIRDIITSASEPVKIVSGGCHLGGVDIWTIEEAEKLGIPTEVFLPEYLGWKAYEKRNRLIARSDIVHCITVDRYPPFYQGMRFDHCYHCGTNDHIKSGGCWTMKKCRQGKLHVVENI